MLLTIIVQSKELFLIKTLYINLFQGRLGALQQKLGSASEGTNSLDSERMSKIDEMTSVAERSRPMYDALPDVIQRLESLQGLHSEVILVQGIVE